MKELLLKELDERLKEYFNTNPTKHITAAREEILESMNLRFSKFNGDIYKIAKRDDCFVWGSLTGYDKQYFVYVG